MDKTAALGSSETVVDDQLHGRSSWSFRLYLVTSTVALWSLHALVLRHTRSVPVDVRPPYLATTVVLMADLSKLVVAGCLLLYTNRFDVARFRHQLRDELWRQPIEVLKMSVPSLVYTVQNNLDFVALSNINAALFSVLSQLKVVTTAVFMVLMLGRRFSLTRWTAIFFVFIGISIVLSEGSQASSSHDAQGKQADKVRNRNGSVTAAAVTAADQARMHLVGVSAVLLNCFLAGFAGVYFEKMLKNSHTSLWMRNLQLYLGGVVCSALSCAAYEGEKIYEHGFFYGYHILVWAIIGLLCFGGIFISMVMKYLDNIHKSFAAAASVLVVSLVSYLFLDSSVGLRFCTGCFLVCCSVVVYNYAPN